MSIKPEKPNIAGILAGITGQEMTHLALASNLLIAMGGRPLIAFRDKVPSYPGKLPGGVLPELVLKLDVLSREQLELFAKVETP